MTQLAEMVDLKEGATVQWVGVYVLKWQPEWGHPTVGFRDKDACEWLYDEVHDVWETTCGESFQFIEGTPTDNLMCYCPYCGCELAHSKRTI